MQPDQPAVTYTQTPTLNMSASSYLNVITIEIEPMIFIVKHLSWVHIPGVAGHVIGKHQNDVVVGDSKPLHCPKCTSPGLQSVPSLHSLRNHKTDTHNTILNVTSPASTSTPNNVMQEFLP
jgi:hypothetical protein